MAQLYFTNGIALASGQLAGTELIPSDGSSTSAALTALQVSQALTSGKYTADASTGDFTATTGEIVGAALTVLELTGTLGAGAVVTTPGASAMVGSLAGAFAGLSYVLRVLHSGSGAFNWTVVGGSGVNVNGTATIAQGTWREFLVTFVTGTSVVLRNIGGGSVV